MRILAWSLLLAVCLPRGECDLAKVEKAFYCGTCFEVLTKASLVSDKVFYRCASCDSTSDKPSKCEDCDQARTKQKSGKDVCGSCYEKPEERLACVKEYFQCDDCDATASKAGKCEDCDVAMTKKTSRALVEYACPECGDSSGQPAKCTDATCKRKGKDLEKTCSASGEFPHVK